jgi:hypothetical protein
MARLNKSLFDNFPMLFSLFCCLFVFFRCSQWVFLQDGKVLSPEKPGATFGSASIVDVAAEDSVLR